MRKTIITAAVAGLLSITLAAPAFAAPKDAKGCENTNASQLEQYCKDTEG